jgi:segregation and condensation protein B
MSDDPVDGAPAGPRAQVDPGAPRTGQDKPSGAVVVLRPALAHAADTVQANLRLSPDTQGRAPGPDLETGSPPFVAPESPACDGIADPIPADAAADPEPHLGDAISDPVLAEPAATDHRGPLGGVICEPVLADAASGDPGLPRDTRDPGVTEAEPAGTPEPTAGPSPEPAAAVLPMEPGEDALRLAEALVFASAAPVSARALSQLLPDTADAESVIAALRARYAGRGVELRDVGNGVQFRTAPDLAPRLRKVIEVPRRLPRVAMETLAIIAYHQPVTRAEVEDIRGTSLSQQTLDALLEAGLVAPKGRKETPGRPTLWGTTPQFLAQFGLKDMRELPRREDLVLEPPQPTPDLVPEAREAAAEDQAVSPDP